MCFKISVITGQTVISFLMVMNEIHGNAITKKQPVFFSPRQTSVQEYFLFGALIEKIDYQNAYWKRLSELI